MIVLLASLSVHVALLLRGCVAGERPNHIPTAQMPRSLEAAT